LLPFLQEYANTRNINNDEQSKCIPKDSAKYIISSSKISLKNDRWIPNL